MAQRRAACCSSKYNILQKWRLCLTRYLGKAETDRYIYIYITIYIYIQYVSISINISMHTHACMHANGCTENWWTFLDPYLVYRLQRTTCMVSHQCGLRGPGRWCRLADPGSKPPAAQLYNTLWPSAASLAADPLHRETLRIPPCWGQTGGKNK